MKNERMNSQENPLPYSEERGLCFQFTSVLLRQQELLQKRLQPQELLLSYL